MTDEASAATRRWAVRRLVVLGVFVAVAATVGFLVPFDVDDVRAQTAELGWAGAVVFVLAYGAVTLSPVPKNVVTIAAGLVWGFGPGVVLVYAGALLGAAVAFLVGRRLGREAVERLTGARVARLDEVLARRGLLAVLGVRLVPLVPFTLVNYGAGLTAVRVRDYALGTAIGIIPGTVAYVALGAFGFELGWPFWIALGAIGVLSLGGALVGLRLRGRERRRAAAPDRSEGAAASDRPGTTGVGRRPETDRGGSDA